MNFLAKFYSTLSLFFHYNSFWKPIFIISPPRSGSTFLFECLATIPGLYHLPFEADNVWWRIFPYSNKPPGPSDYVPWNESTSSKALTLRRELYERAVKYTLKKKEQTNAKFEHIFGLKKIRYLDKTIANCFHLDFLEKTFPDAQYVFLIRDPRATIASMIEGWPHQHMFGKPQLKAFFSNCPSFSISHWCYPVPPGWQSMLDRPLPEICAWSWRQHVAHAMAFFDRKNISAIKVYYEDLLRDTTAVVEGLSAALDLPFSPEVRAYLQDPPLSRTTISPPSPRKWEIGHREDILRIMPSIAEVANNLGYHF